VGGQEVDTSFLAMPDDFPVRNEYWKKLTSEKMLWHELSQLVRQRATNSTFDELHAHLEKWSAFVSNEEEKGRLSNGKHQWAVASKFLELAQEAAAQPATGDETLDRALFPYLSAWEWDVFCDLRGTPRRLFTKTRRSLSVLFEQQPSRAGCLAVLDVVFVANGRGEIYADPKSNAFIKFDQSFLNPIQKAWEWAQADATQAKERDKLRQVDARFRLKQVKILLYPNPPLDLAIGDSAQAAFYICLLHAAKAYLGKSDARLLDKSVAVTANLERNDDGEITLGAVGGLDAKLEAAYLRGLRTVIVAEEIEEEAQKALEDAKLRVRREKSPDYSELTQVLSCKDPTSAAEEASGLVHEVIEYLTGLVDNLDTTPWYRDGQPIRANTIAIPARIIKEEVEKEEEVEEEEVEKLSEHPSFPSNFREEGRKPKKEKEPAYFRVDAELAKLYEEPAQVKRKTIVPWEHERQLMQRAVIIGAPGGGKSFLTNITAINVAQKTLVQLRRQAPLDSLSIPVHLELADLAQQGLPAEPAEAVLQLLQQKYTLSVRLVEWVRTKLATDRCWLILDALDQVPEADRPQLRRRLEAMETKRWQCHVVLTCRTANYERSWIPWQTVTEYDLAPFEPREIRQFIERWFGPSDARRKPLLRVLDYNFPLAHACRSPLIVTLTCLAHEEQAITEQTRRGDLYTRVLRGLLRRAWKDNPMNRDNPRIDDMLRLLEHIGWTLFNLRPEANLFTNSEVVNALQFAPNAPLPRILQQQMAGGELQLAMLAYAPSLLRDELLESGILVGAGLSRGGETQFSFLHRTFLEFLTACALARSTTPLLSHSLTTSQGSLRNKRRRAKSQSGWEAVAALIDRKAWLPAWHEVIVFLAGQLPDALSEHLLVILTDETKDDMFCHRLALAAHCLTECRITRQRAIDESTPRILAIVDKMTTTLFKLWWNFQMRGMDFPHLERTLPALAQVNGRVDNTPLLSYIARLLQREKGKVNRALDRVGEAISQSFFGNLKESEIGCIVQLLALLFYGFASYLFSIFFEKFREKARRVRYIALNAVGIIGAVAATEEILSLLPRLMRDAYWDVRRAAVETVGKLGAVAATEEILSLLPSLLKDNNDEVRKAAVDAIGRIGEACVSEEFLSHLAHLIYADCEAAVGAIGRIGEACVSEEFLSHLTRLLLDEDADVHRAALNAIDRIGAAAATENFLSHLTCLMQDENATVREMALAAVGRIGSAAATEEILSLLPHLLEDKHSDVRWRALQAVGELGEVAATEEILSLLPSLLEDKCSERVNTVEAVGKIGAVAANEEILSLLPCLLKDKYPSVRMRAVEAVGKIGAIAANEEILSHLARLLQDEDKDVRVKAAEAVGKLGAVAATEEILPLLTHLVVDGYPTVLTAAAQAISQLGEAAAIEEVLSLLPRLLKTRLMDVGRGQSAALAIGNLGAAVVTNEILSLLALLLQDESEWVRMGALDAVGRLGSAAATEEFLSLLARLMKDKNGVARRSAFDAVGRLGEAAATKEILSLLARLMKDGSESVCEEAVRTVGKLGAVAATEEILTNLARLMKNRTTRFWEALEYFLRLDEYNISVRAKALDTVCELGEAAMTNEILSLLPRLLKDRFMRVEAAEAVCKLGEAAMTNEILSLLPRLLKEKNQSWSNVKPLVTMMQQGIRFFQPRRKIFGGRFLQRWRKVVAKSVTELAADP
jgi:HEAT repeat protein